MTRQLDHVGATHAPGRRQPEGILVTGSHRSGSTWVGRMLALSTETYYVGELFNPTSDLWLGPEHIQHWFQYVTDGSARGLEAPVQRMLDLDFRWPDRKGLKRLVPSRLVILRHTRRWLGWPRPIIKDPIAIFASEWLARTFGLRVVCLVRHPAAFVASLRRANWSADLRPFSDQPQLMDDWLYPFADRLARPPETYVERAALMWLCLYHVLLAYVDRHPEWVVCRIEDVAGEPEAVFKGMYFHLGLPYTDRVRAGIRRHSSPTNPVDAAPGDPHAFMRHSRAVQRAWRQQLTAGETHAIRRLVEPLSRRYYSDADW